VVARGTTVSVSHATFEELTGAVHKPESLIDDRPRGGAAETADAITELARIASDRGGPAGGAAKQLGFKIIHLDSPNGGSELPRARRFS
jgi:hypothetical protein